MNNHPLIFVSNDDGWQAPGVQQLVRALNTLGHVVCVCPDSARSGQSMALTFNAPLRLEKVEVPDTGDAQFYAVNGTPVDCVKLAMYTLFADRKPDLMVSGINHGSNASVNVLYSGTMGAAFEACACGIPAAGFSLTSHSWKADMTPVLPYVLHIGRQILLHGLPQGVCLNVNVPAGSTPTAARVVRAAASRWTDEYRQYDDPLGHPFYWLTGRMINLEPEATDTDLYALAQNYVSIVPCSLDRTAPTLPKDCIQALDYWTPQG